MKKHLLFSLFLPILGIAQIPQYYNNIDFKQSKEIVKSQITYLITNTHTEIGYNKVWEVLDRAEKTLIIRIMYSLFMDTLTLVMKRIQGLVREKKQANIKVGLPMEDGTESMFSQNP